MPITTPLDLIRFSLKGSGALAVGQTPLAEDLSDAFSALNGMLAIWNRRRWMVYHLIDVAKVSTGARSYSVGPGGDYNIPRVDRLEAAYFRQYINAQTGVAGGQLLLDGIGGGLALDGIGGTLSLDGLGPSSQSTSTTQNLALDGGGGQIQLDGIGGPLALDGIGGGSSGGTVGTSGAPYSVDYPLEILQSREDYSGISLKLLQSWPQYVFYDSGWPLGYVYPWPIPQASLYELHLVVKDTLTGFSSYTQQINLPPEYIEPLWTNLTIRLAPIFQFAVRSEIVGLAKSSLETIRGSNTQVPRLGMPPGLAQPARYNIFSDSQY